MGEVYVIGVGQSRFGKYPSSSVSDMAGIAINLALLDAGLDRSDLQAVFFANSLWGHFEGHHCLKGQVAVRALGLDRVPVINVENGCAGGATALHLAYMSVRAGMFDLALALGVEKMEYAGQEVPFGVLQGESDKAETPSALQLHLSTLAEEGRDPAGMPVSNASYRAFMANSAAAARRHCQRHGTTREQLAAIASKNHFHGSLNPRSQDQQPLGVGEVLAGPLVADPLTRSMCAPTGDGGAAVVLCSDRVLARLGKVRPVRVLASILGQGGERDRAEERVGVRVGKLAYTAAGIGPGDVDVAELHDATAYNELRQTELLGFCAIGGGGALAASGATRLGGRIPVNTSGGLESRGNPIAATGLAQIHEIATQLRGEAGRRQVEGAKVGLTQCGGGLIGMELAAVCVHILERVGP